MIDTRIVNGDLCETFSTENKKLLQKETGFVYGASVVDIIGGYNNGKPYAPFTYEETGEYDVTESDPV